MTADIEPTTGDSTNDVWSPLIKPTPGEHICNVCGVRTTESQQCCIVEEGVKNIITGEPILCNHPAVFHCAGKCQRSFCSLHAFNSNGYCADCWPLKYPDGALRDF